MFKKLVLYFSIIVILFTTVGCVKENEQEKNETMSDKTMTSEVTQDNLSTFPVTDESTFNTEPVEGGVSITGCSYEGDVIVIPEKIGGNTVVGISDYAFAMSKMQGIVLPDTVKTIGRGVFEMCYNLKYVDLGSGLKSIDSMAFNNCTILQRVEFPDGMTTFYGIAFNNCDALTEIIIPNSVIKFDMGIVETTSCPNAVIVTPAGSKVEADCIAYNVPYRSS